MKSGMTLKELARMVGTSAATMSRYENRWDRFEVRTLKKIASALGCELQVDFVSPHTPAAKERVKNQGVLVRKFRPYFSEKKLTKEDLEDYSSWVIARILELGDLPEIAALEWYYGRTSIARVVETVPGLSKKTVNFWKKLLGIRRSECIGKSFRKEAGKFWKF